MFKSLAFRCSLYASILTMIVMFGCVAPSNISESNGYDGSWHFSVVNANADFADYTAEWLDEIKSRYNDAVVVFVHGETIDGKWYAFPDVGLPIPMTALVHNIRMSEPDRLIILISCNPNHHEFDMPGVAYATENVWVFPDSVVHGFSAASRDFAEPEVVGDIDEFVVNPF